MLFSVLVCAIVLMAIGYLALLFGMEVTLWLRSRLVGNARHYEHQIVQGTAKTAMR